MRVLRGLLLHSRISIVYTVQHKNSNSLCIRQPISVARTNRRKKSLKKIGPCLWNNLPLNIRPSQSIASFKYHLKHCQLQNTFLLFLLYFYHPFPICDMYIVDSRQLIVKPPLATARAAQCVSAVHLFVCLSIAKIKKTRGFLKN